MKFKQENGQNGRFKVLFLRNIPITTGSWELVSKLVGKIVKWKLFEWTLERLVRLESFKRADRKNERDKPKVKRKIDIQNQTGVMIKDRKRNTQKEKKLTDM